MSFVETTDVPSCIAEKVAEVSRRRTWTDFDNHRAVPAYDSDQSLNVAWAAAHVADVCNALGLTPAQLWAISDVAAGDGGSLIV